MMEHKIEGGKGGEDREGKGRKGKEREMKGGNGRREGKEGKGWDVREREIPRLERPADPGHQQVVWYALKMHSLHVLHLFTSSSLSSSSFCFSWLGYGTCNHNYLINKF